MEMLPAKNFAGAREIWLRRGNSGTYEVGRRKPRIPRGGTNRHESRVSALRSGTVGGDPRLFFSWRVLLFSVSDWCLRRSCKFGSRMERDPPGYGHTTGVLAFAGMKGRPMGGSLFNHVLFFQADGVSLAELGVLYKV